MHFTFADWITLVLLIGTPALWIVAECKNHRALRVTCGLLMVFMLTGAWLHARQRLAYAEVTMTSAVRYINAAIEEGDFDGAHNALDEFARIGGRVGAAQCITRMEEHRRSSQPPVSRQTNGE
jgi:hypothetical protein